MKCRNDVYILTLH